MDKQTIHNELILELFMEHDGSIKEFLKLPETMTNTLQVMLKGMVDQGLIEIRDDKCFLTTIGRDAVLNCERIKH